MSIENYITQKTKRSIIINVQDEEQNAKSICTDEVDRKTEGFEFLAFKEFLPLCRY